MLSEIGSNFWISPNELSLQVLEITPEKFNCKGSDYVWMSTGRGLLLLYWIQLKGEILMSVR